MDVRPAEATDGDAIERVVRRSLEASYALSPEVIQEIAGEYAGDALADRIDDAGEVGDGRGFDGREFDDGRASDDGQVNLVAETDVEVVGFTRGRLAEDGVGEVVWLHVAPAGRGRGAGTGLFERLRDELEARGASHLRVLVLADNQEGDEFAERFGLREIAETEVERAGISFSAAVYADDEAAVDGDEMTRVSDGVEDVEAVDASGPEAVDVPDSVTADGREVFVEADDTIPGNEGPFFRTYSDEAGEELYGYYCGNCGSTATAMDELERIECADCGNVHRADQWDAAYL